MTSGIVIRDDSIWQGHPDVASFKGNIYVAFRQSYQHKATDETSVGVVSSINGESFSSPSYVFKSDEGRYNCPRLKVIEDKLWLICDFVKAKPDQDFIDAENDESNNSIHICYTEDGQDWSEVHETNIRGIVPDKIHRTRGGFYLIAAHRFQPREMPSLSGKRGSLVQDLWRSDSPVGVWERSKLAGHTRFNFCEASIAENSSGHLVCLMRENSQLGLPAFISYSFNQGRTWTDHRKTRLFGCHRPVLGRLSSGYFFATYREQSSVFGGGHWARNTFACLITPNCLFDIDDACNSINILPLDHDNSIRPDGGYTGWVELPDGNIYVVNYITKDAPKPYIKWYKVNIREF